MFLEAELRTKDPRTKEPRRKAGRNEWEHRQRRGARGCVKVALGEDLLRRGAALEHGWLCRRASGRKREPIRRGGEHSTGRLGLLPRREAPRGGECRLALQLSSSWRLPAQASSPA